jgi:hypothetical protein
MKRHALFESLRAIGIIYETYGIRLGRHLQKKKNVSKHI